MKRLFYSFFVVLFLSISVNSNAQKVDSRYEVATWFEFRDAAVSYTFDDGCPNQFAKVIPLFDEFGYKLTLFTVTDWSSSNWTILQSVAKNGHEVASHTVSHPNFSSTTLENQLKELQNSKLEIEKKIANIQCVTFAYPFCATGDYSICRRFYISARGCQGFVEEKTPKDMLKISSIVCGTEGSLKTAADINNTAQSAISAKGWAVLLFHGIDNDGGYSPFPLTELRKNLEYMKKNESRIWVATFADASRYVRERDALNVKELKLASDCITLEVSDTLDNALFNHAVSLSRSLPANWTDAEVTQNGKSVASKLIEVGTSRKVQFDVVPDAGEVKILKR